MDAVDSTALAVVSAVIAAAAAGVAVWRSVLAGRIRHLRPLSRRRAVTPGWSG